MATNIIKVPVENLTVGQEFRWDSRLPARVEQLPSVWSDEEIQVRVSRPKPGSTWERKNSTFWVPKGTLVRLV